MGRLFQVTSRSDAASPGLDDPDGEGALGSWLSEACDQPRFGAQKTVAQKRTINKDCFLKRLIRVGWMRFSGSRYANDFAGSIRQARV